MRNQTIQTTTQIATQSSLVSNFRHTHKEPLSPVSQQIRCVLHPFTSPYSTDCLAHATHGVRTRPSPAHRTLQSSSESMTREKMMRAKGPKSPGAKMGTTTTQSPSSQRGPLGLECPQEPCPNLHQFALNTSHNSFDVFFPHWSISLEIERPERHVYERTGTGGSQTQTCNRTFGSTQPLHMRPGLSSSVSFAFSG